MELAKSFTFHGVGDHHGRPAGMSIFASLRAYQFIFILQPSEIARVIILASFGKSVLSVKT